MNPATLLHRQIHPGFVHAGRVSSQAFRPTPKDENYLSCYDGDMIRPEAAWKHYTGSLGLNSIGTMSVSHQECTSLSVPVVEDRQLFSEHVSLNFFGCSKSQAERIGSRLRDLADRRSWTFGPCEVEA